MIAEKYSVSAERLILENGLISLYLVPGQTIIILYPEQTYVVQAGDTLAGIAANHGISLLQILRNNPYLSDRYIYPGETIVINYRNNNWNYLDKWVL